MSQAPNLHFVRQLLHADKFTFIYGKLMINNCVMLFGVWNMVIILFVNLTETFGVEQPSLTEGSDIWASECSYL